MPITISENAVTADLIRQPLRIPGGWSVDHNELRQLEPSQLGAEDPLWCFFTEDLLQLREVHRGFLLDVGWYPDSRPEGHFRAVLIRNQDWAHPLRTYETHALPELVQKIEDWLLRPVP
jgi:hypothetical protein